MLARWLVLLTIAPAFVMPAPQSAQADDLRIRQLENEVLRLQRELDAQSRRLDVLERGARSGLTAPAPVAPSLSRRSEDSPAWLVPTNWNRIRPGMKELDVIALLGRPTSARADADGTGRTLFYALELGPTAILAGSVRFDSSGATEVSKPVLK